MHGHPMGAPGREGRAATWQVMIGRCLVSSDGRPNYTPRWRNLRRWVYQAQYFWFDEEGSPRALCGEAFETQPGALLHSRIAYSAASGAISASISEVSEADAEATSGSAAQQLGGARVSTIEIAAPLLHSRDFATWRDFFAAAAASSRTDGALARPRLCIEYKGAVRDAVSLSYRHAPAPA